MHVSPETDRYGRMTVRQANQVRRTGEQTNRAGTGDRRDEDRKPTNWERQTEKDRTDRETDYQTDRQTATGQMSDVGQQDTKSDHVPHHSSFRSPTGHGARSLSFMLAG